MNVNLVLILSFLLNFLKFIHSFFFLFFFTCAGSLLGPVGFLKLRQVGILFSAVKGRFSFGTQAQQLCLVVSRAQAR